MAEKESKSAEQRNCYDIPTEGKGKTTSSRIAWLVIMQAWAAFFLLMLMGIPATMFEIGKDEIKNKIPPISFSEVVGVFAVLFTIYLSLMVVDRNRLTAYMGKNRATGHWRITRFGTTVRTSVTLAKTQSNTIGEILDKNSESEAAKYFNPILYALFILGHLVASLFMVQSCVYGLSGKEIAYSIVPNYLVLLVLLYIMGALVLDSADAWRKVNDDAEEYEIAVYFQRLIRAKAIDDNVGNVKNVESSFMQESVNNFSRWRKEFVNSEERGSIKPIVSAVVAIVIFFLALFFLALLLLQLILPNWVEDANVSLGLLVKNMVGVVLFVAGGFLLVFLLYVGRMASVWGNFMLWFSTVTISSFGMLIILSKTNGVGVSSPALRLHACLSGLLMLSFLIRKFQPVFKLYQSRTVLTAYNNLMQMYNRGSAMFSLDVLPLKVMLLIIGDIPNNAASSTDEQSKSG